MELDSDEGRSFCVGEDTAASALVELFLAALSIKKKAGFYSTGYWDLRHLSMGSCVY